MDMLFCFVSVDTFGKLRICYAQGEIAALLSVRVLSWLY